MIKILILPLLLSGVAMAQEREQPQQHGYEASQQAIGVQTRLWLELQRSGTQATTRHDRLTPDAAARVNERMLESFSHPIPEYFAEDSFGED